MEIIQAHRPRRLGCKKGQVNCALAANLSAEWTSPQPAECVIDLEFRPSQLCTTIKVETLIAPRFVHVIQCDKCPVSAVGRCYPNCKHENDSFNGFRAVREFLFTRPQFVLRARSDRRSLWVQKHKCSLAVTWTKGEDEYGNATLEPWANMMFDTVAQDVTPLLRIELTHCLHRHVKVAVIGCVPVQERPSPLAPRVPKHIKTRLREFKLWPIKEEAI